MSVRALVTEGIGPGGSVLFALTGGLDIGAAPTPVTVTDIRMGQLTMRSGLLSLRNDSGSNALRMNSGTVELVITS